MPRSLLGAVALGLAACAGPDGGSSRWGATPAPADFRAPAAASSRGRAETVARALSSQRAAFIRTRDPELAFAVC